MSDEMGEVVGYLFLLLLIIAAVVAVIVFIIVPLLIISMGTGALYGGGNAAYNYAVSFRKNVKPERVK